MARSRLSEQRARTVTRELLSFRGWDLRPVSSGGQLLEEAEYRAYPVLSSIFEGRSKSGSGLGKPDFLLVDSALSLKPLVVIDTKATTADLPKALIDTQHYGDAVRDSGKDALSVAVAGAEQELCQVRVQRNVEGNWKDLTLHNRSIDWIPSPDQTNRILSLKRITEVSPERPPDKVLAEQANRLNEILRECNIKDEYRPIYAATFMLATWFNELSTDPRAVLEQVNANARLAFESAQKNNLAGSLRVNTSNKALASKAWQIIDILTKLNIRSFIQEHDYLGQLYETFFKYTGGNTIGQYFTPRHIVDFMCELVGVTPSDLIFDPACGTGGFLVGALKRMIRLENLDYEEAIDRVRHNIFGIESEPTTAALCVANMILRGDGKSGVIQADCFERRNYPAKPVDCALLNPPFPHKKKTQKPASAFIERAMESVKNRGYVAAVVPYSLLANVKEWHKNVLRENSLVFVATMTADLFNPYSNYDTAVVLLQKGVPHNGKHVFFCRIDNDGYKLKKAIRVPNSGGSQLGPALDAFSRKKEIPEFTAYRPVTQNTPEWAPETFIESAPHDDEKFIAGLEEFVRQEAAFYFRYGHRLLGGNASVGTGNIDALFSGKSPISLKGVELGRFKVSDYFTVSLGGKDEIEDLDEGNDPFISTSGWDNGLAAWKKARTLFFGPAITVATDGSAYASFVQEFPFYAFYKVAILRPKVRRDVPVDAYHYVSYLLRREEWRFVRARKYGKGRIENTYLYAPVRNGKPDFNRMAELVRQAAAYPVIEAFRKAYQEVTRRRFAELADEWKRTRNPMSSAVRMANHPAYEQIIRMGDPVVPLILNDLKTKPEHWFIALTRITSHNPVSENARGRVADMSKAWLQWGKEQGYLPSK